MIEYSAIEGKDDYLEWCNQQLLLWLNLCIDEYDELDESLFSDLYVEELFPRTYAEDHSVRQCYSTLLDIKDVLISPLLQELSPLQTYVAIMIIEFEITEIKDSMNANGDYDYLLYPMNDNLKAELLPEESEEYDSDYTYNDRLINCLEDIEDELFDTAEILFMNEYCTMIIDDVEKGIIDLPEMDQVKDLMKRNTKDRYRIPKKQQYQKPRRKTINSERLVEDVCMCCRQLQAS